MEIVPSDLDTIKARNARVEMEKAWETSITRRTSIAIITYLTAGLFLWLTGNPLFWLHALVPTGGYLLSTLSLPWIKRWWMRRRTAPVTP